MKKRLSVMRALQAPRDFTFAVYSPYRLSTSRVKTSDMNNDLPGIDPSLNYKKRHEDTDPECMKIVGSRKQSDAWPERRHLKGGKHD
jgi:hypothetical protein